MPAGECCGSQNQLFTTEDQTKKRLDLKCKFRRYGAML